ncbi:HPF/RaiA family ribosome-associated protein [Frigoriflavimonas asaccharolytica]|uniref:Ribosome-associated translation inhibitor RaiA n=1 Tax=Frigoriflavimonas asaccharolytica TaxID=2735899 RepID=A0A8J8GB20_9FLAO|nr:HPF/RaiA family ribosome-associated protein [Frigoriflavimonas asaccharolytica]NRS93237.1 ribosome-associated translation inhibitor RaiA [Frigoriflavimonas asaccharolytica]
MDVKINTDNHIEGHQRFIDNYIMETEKALGRFDNYVTRFEVYFSDENSDKNTPDDKKCVIEARVKHKNPERVSHNASEIHQAFDGAVRKMKTVLDKVIDMQQSH